jgi:hypothetical protein
VRGGHATPATKLTHRTRFESTPKKEGQYAPRPKLLTNAEPSLETEFNSLLPLARGSCYRAGGSRLSLTPSAVADIVPHQEVPTMLKHTLSTGNTRSTRHVLFTQDYFNLYITTAQLVVRSKWW